MQSQIDCIAPQRVIIIDSFNEKIVYCHGWCPHYKVTPIFMGNMELTLDLIIVAVLFLQFILIVISKMWICTLSSCKDQIIIISLHELDILSPLSHVVVVHWDQLPRHLVMHPSS